MIVVGVGLSTVLFLVGKEYRLSSSDLFSLLMTALLIFLPSLPSFFYLHCPIVKRVLRLVAEIELNWIIKYLKVIKNN